MLLRFLVLCIFTLTFSHAKERFNYTLLGIGIQETKYEQKFNTSGDGDYTLSSSSSSPYYFTGSLSRFNEKFDFELIAASTLFANTSTEKVSSNYQTKEHKLDMTLTDIELNLHYKSSNELHRQVFGLKYTYEVLKRYEFTQDSLKQIGVLENKIASLNLSYGYLYTNTNQTGKEPWHYRVGANFGIPFYSLVADTHPAGDYAHGSTYGYALSTNGYLAYTLFEGFELGGYANYSYQVRFDNIKYDDAAGNTIESSHSTVSRLNFGLISSWSF